MSRKKEGAVTIVLAWVVPDFEVVRERRRDLGERPEMKEIKVPKAVVWLKSGDDADIEKAKAYASKETEYEIAVFTYPTSEKDPLGKAKREVLKHV
jgi:hypothetical protein